MSAPSSYENVLLHPQRKAWISAGINGHEDKTGHVERKGHAYNAYDFGYWGYDPSMPNDTGENAQLYAMADGVVLDIVDGYPDYYTDTGYGNYIIIQYPSLGYTVLWGHIKKNSFLVKIGQRVYQGQAVCRQDNSGYSFGSHLHMEVCEGDIFKRHQGIDYISREVVKFVPDWHIVDPDTIKRYPIAWIVISPTFLSVAKDQIYVECKDLRIRTAPSLSADTKGFAPMGVYDVSETVEADGYTWCKVGDYYLAVTDESTYHEATFVPTDPDPTVNQCEVSINDLRIRLEPSTSSTIMGYCPEGYYTITDTAEAEDMIWFHVCGYWIACVDGVRYIPAEDDPQKEIEELKAELRKAEETIIQLTENVELQKQTIDSLNIIIEEQAEVIRKDVAAFTEIERISARMIPE